MTTTQTVDLGRAAPVTGWFSPAGLTFGCGLVLALLGSFLQRGGHDEQRIVQIVFLVLCALVLPVRRSPVVAPPPAIMAALAGFFALGILSSMFAFSPRMAAYEVATWALTVAAALAIGGEVARQGPDGALRLMRLAALAGGVYALKVAAVYVSVFILGVQPAAGDFTPGFPNYRFFNYAQTLLLPLLLPAYMLSAPGSSVRRAWFCVCSLWVALIFVTGARGTALGLAAGMMATAMVLRRNSWPFLKAAAAIALGGVVLFVLFFNIVPVLMGMQPFGEFGAVASRTVDSPASGRMMLWNLSASLIADHPWFGAGPMHFAHHAIPLQEAAHPHDWVLQVAAEWGVPALLCLVVAIGLAGNRLRQCALLVKAGDAPQLAVAAALLAAGAAVVVDGLVSGNIVMPHSQLALCLYLGLAAGWCASLRPAVPASLGALPRGLVLLALAALVYGTWPEIVDKASHEPLTPAEAAVNGAVVCPRLWLHGFF